MALSTLFATELTSEAAPRTVLHAAIVKDPAISARVVNIRNIVTLLYIPGVQARNPPDALIHGNLDHNRANSGRNAMNVCKTKVSIRQRKGREKKGPPNDGPIHE